MQSRYSNIDWRRLIITKFSRVVASVFKIFPPRWRKGECSPDRAGTGKIIYLGRTKVASAALQEDIDLSKIEEEKLDHKLPGPPG